MPGPIFVHCRRGKDRTGTVIACYRIQHDGWANHAGATRGQQIRHELDGARHAILYRRFSSHGSAAVANLPAELVCTDVDSFESDLDLY